VPALQRVVVVLGAHATTLLRVVDFGRAETVICERWRLGQSESLRCGLAQIPDASRVIVTLGDEPLMTPAVIARFLHAPPGARALYDGRPGHPVVLGRKEIWRIERLKGDRGARGLIAGGPGVECGDLSPGRDVDTLADLEAIRAAAGLRLTPPGR
jgi:CTP:molybdopterin cytidylyltransferase MocA